jgi:hypothetical protein
MEGFFFKFFIAFLFAAVFYIWVRVILWSLCTFWGTVINKYFGNDD